MAKKKEKAIVKKPKALEHIPKYKSRRVISTFIFVFILIGSMLSYLPKGTNDAKVVDISAETFIKKYIMHKFNSTKEGQDWVGTYELSSVPAPKFQKDVITYVPNVTVYSYEFDEQNEAYQCYKVGFTLDTYDEKTSEKLGSTTEHGRICLIEAQKDLYVVSKGFEFMSYEYAYLPNENKQELQNEKMKSEAIEGDAVDETRKKVLADRAVFFFEQYNQSKASAQQLTETDVTLPDRSNGTFGAPHIITVVEDKENYILELKIPYSEADGLIEVEYNYQLSISKTSDKITSLKLV